MVGRKCLEWNLLLPISGTKQLLAKMFEGCIISGFVEGWLYQLGWFPGMFQYFHLVEEAPQAHDLKLETGLYPFYTLLGQAISISSFQPSIAIGERLVSTNGAPDRLP